jgi:hypothetical protein
MDWMNDGFAQIVRAQQQQQQQITYSIVFTLKTI